MVVRLVGEESQGSSSSSSSSSPSSSLWRRRRRWGGSSTSTTTTTSLSIQYWVLAILVIGGAVLPNVSKSMTMTRTTRTLTTTSLSSRTYHNQQKEEEAKKEEAMNAPFPRAWSSLPIETSSSSKMEETEKHPGNTTTGTALPTEPRQEEEEATTTIPTTTATSRSAVPNTTQQQQQLSHELLEQTQDVVVQMTGGTKEVPTTATATATALTPSENNQSNHETNESNDNNKRRPLNILILYPDDWRHDTIGKENSIVQTPFLDSLADQGIRFRQNAVTSSICWVSRATLFTGQWASRHQSHKLICPHFAAGSLWNETSWPGILRNHGYHIGHVGKWQFYNSNHGRFDFQKLHEGQHWYPSREGKIAADDLATRDALEFLRGRPKEKPFAMTVAFYPPKPVGMSEVPGAQFMPKNSTRALYDNITIPELYNMTHARSLLPLFLQFDRSAAVARFRQRYKTQEHYQESMKNMYALITQIDQACRDIVEEIKSQGLLNETMIIFTTDNGMFNGAHGLAGKWYPYQESIRVPLIIHDPRIPESKRGSVNDDFTLNVDLAETILGAAGLPPHLVMQGRDIADLYMDDREAVRKDRPWRDEFFYELDVEEGRHVPASNALVRKKFKYIHWYPFGHEQLFNLEDDPLEFTDVKDRPENADILKEMRDRMAVLKVEAAGGPNFVKKECKRVDLKEMDRLFSMGAVESINYSVW